MQCNVSVVLSLLVELAGGAVRLVKIPGRKGWKGELLEGEDGLIVELSSFAFELNSSDISVVGSKLGLVGGLRRIGEGSLDGDGERRRVVSLLGSMVGRESGSEDGLTDGSS